jgi:hypothetical protein
MRAVAFVVSVGVAACGSLLGNVDDDVDAPPRSEDAGSEAAAVFDGAPDVASGDGGPGDDAEASVDAEGGTARTERYVFISSERYAGNFGTRTVADATCKQLARAANMALFGQSEFKAYLAGGNGVAPQVFVKDQAYVRMGDKKVVFAAGWTASANPTPLDFIAFDEKGNNLMAVVAKQVWTGVATGIAASERTCGDWATGNGANGGFGDIQNLAMWQNNGGQTAPCESTYRIYCFED